jgi:hypothetical protein
MDFQSFCSNLKSGLIGFSGKAVYTEVPGLKLNQPTQIYPCATIPLSRWQSKSPLTFPSSSPRSFPYCKQYPRERKGRPGLPATREVQRGVGLARGGSGGHSDVRLDGGDGRNRSVHVRRRVCRPNHGELVQSKGTVSFTGRRRDRVHKESENGSVDYPVHALRRGCELRRPWTGLSGEVGFDSSLGELH